MKPTDLPTTCGQSGCDREAIGRYTWPGRDEAGICAEHIAKLLAIAEALGLPLQVIPLPRSDAR